MTTEEEIDKWIHQGEWDLLETTTEFLERALSILKVGCLYNFTNFDTLGVDKIRSVYRPDQTRLEQGSVFLIIEEPQTEISPWTGVKFVTYKIMAPPDHFGYMRLTPSEIVRWIHEVKPLNDE